MHTGPSFEATGFAGICVPMLILYPSSQDILLGLLARIRIRYPVPKGALAGITQVIVPPELELVVPILVGNAKLPLASDS